MVPDVFLPHHTPYHTLNIVETYRYLNELESTAKISNIIKLPFKSVFVKQRKIFYEYNVNFQPNSTTPLTNILCEIVFVVYRFIILYTMCICIHVC